MVTDCERWHCLAVKSLSKILRGITSNHNVDYCYINCLYSFRTESKFKQKHQDYCQVIFSEEENKILKYNQDKKIFEEFNCYLCRNRTTAEYFTTKITYGV